MQIEARRARPIFRREPEQRRRPGLRALRLTGEEPGSDDGTAQLPPALRAQFELTSVLGFLGQIGIGPELLPGLVETKDGLASISGWRWSSTGY
jgi:hypothetical protein